MGQIRWSDSDAQPVLMDKLQKSQNKLLRFLNELYMLAYQFMFPVTITKVSLKVIDE